MDISQIKAKIEIDINDIAPGFPMNGYYLGAMGFYAWLPFLECNHGMCIYLFSQKKK